MRMLVLAGVLVVGSASAPLASAADSSGLARVAAEKLVARKALRPETHTTDFQGDSLGCITLSRWELQPFGYRGHAFFCENGTTGEVLGAVLSPGGFVRCYISGDYVGDACYAFTICGIADGACVR